ncbi:MAG TPA: tetratricopeptide repeat protein, partial [Thermohalobaculum sp.]|nr:tetratricopeptide repeat protein [Thermohalobaculum sp.]
VHVYHWPSASEKADSDGAPSASTHPAELALPDKPSIAVLPFDNMSADPDQEFFAEGIAEDIITELSKFRSLFVIARNSSFAFKGKALDVKEIGRRLGVRYVVEGSVRRAGNRVRVTAQLIDAVDDTHLWAERYDRGLEDIFAVQDEVTQAIVTTIEPHLADTERQRARRKPPESLGAWESYQRGLWHLFQFTQAEVKTSIRFMEQAVERDPDFATARAGLAYALYYHMLSGATQDWDGDAERALAAARRAVTLDGSDPFAHIALSRMHAITGRHDAAIAHCDRAIGLNPSYAMAHFGRAHSLWMSGHPAEALPSNEEAMRLSPNDPLMWAFMASRSIALTLLERYDEALDWARRGARQANTGLYSIVAEIAALGHLGRVEEAADAIARACEKRPSVSVPFLLKALPITDPACRVRFEEGLRKAGLGD